MIYSLIFLSTLLFNSPTIDSTVVGDTPKFSINIINNEWLDKTPKLLKANIILLTEDFYWLTRVVSAEAKGEDKIGQVAVANVVINRVKYKYFPSNIKEVIFQHKQFSPVHNGTIYDKPSNSAIQSAFEALMDKKIIEEDEVLYFYNKKLVSRSWLDTRRVYRKIGNHTFTY